MASTIVFLCCLAVAYGKIYKGWKTSDFNTEVGHYPQPYCSFTNVVLNGTDGVFYYKSVLDLHSEECRLADNVWDIQHNPDLDNVDCAEMYKTGYAYLMYYWHTSSNYFHLHYDTLFPLYEEVYYKQKKAKGKIAFMPTVESSRLQRLTWDTAAFDDSQKFWMQIVEFLAGRHDFLPLNRSLLTPGRNLCFKNIKFGTPRMDCGDKEFVRSFVKYAKNSLGIDEPRLEHEKLGIISRSNRRRILNQLELVKELDPIIETELVVLEGMSFKEQVQAMQNFTIMVGMNGAGLMNCIYLPANSVCIQMVPYEAAVNFAQYGELLKSRGHYLEWHNKNPSLHQPMPGDTNNNFPDTVVDVAEFKELVLEAINMTRRLKPDYREEL